MFVYSKDLKPLLKEKGIKQATLAEKLGISTRAIKGWISGINSPTYERHLELMEILGVENEYNNDESIISIPVLSYVQAGEFTDSAIDIEPIDYLKIPKELVPKDGFSLKVQGDSMLYDICEHQKLDSRYSKFTLYDGENIIIDPNDKNIQSLLGKVVVARNNDGATVKLLHKENNEILLMPLNSKYQDNQSILKPDEAEIIGKVVNAYSVRSFS
ncbi:LexA family protein [Francisella salimarina]|uniref:Helix-turn-helix domain-containing protein n=1 Tax=Francisella salimarina TaxID=2599927 RepID=A0AAJ4TLN5_9GAMM|nr:S24 family peptidase [Francisella salimarina]QWV00066.1 helix-turn-helix domain-containing protein [Francisella salimarina]